MREKNIKVTKNDIYSPTKVQVEVPVEKNQNYYKQLNKYLICDNFIPDKNLRNNRNKEEVVDQFSQVETERAFKTCQNGETFGIYGLKYDDIKLNWKEYAHDITKVFNTTLVNQKIINKFILLKEPISCNIDVCLLSETKIDEPFPNTQLETERHRILYKDKNKQGVLY